MDIHSLKLTLDARSEILTDCMSALNSLEDGREVRATLIIYCGNDAIEIPYEIDSAEASAKITARRDQMRKLIVELL